MKPVAIHLAGRDILLDVSEHRCEALLKAMLLSVLTQ